MITRDRDLSRQQVFHTETDLAAMGPVVLSVSHENKRFEHIDARTLNQSKPEMRQAGYDPALLKEWRIARDVFIDQLDAHRQEIGRQRIPRVEVPLLRRLEVMDKAALIQTEYMLDAGLPLTHVTDFNWLLANHGEAVNELHLQPSVRSRGRLDIAVLEVTQQTQRRYGPSGVTETLAAGTTNPGEILAALLASPYHQPVLEDLSLKDIGVAHRVRNGMPMWAMVWGPGSQYQWALTSGENPYQVSMPVIMNGAGS